MHTTHLTPEWIAIHHGDHSGETILRQIVADRVVQEIEVPTSVLVDYVRTVHARREESEE